MIFGFVFIIIINMLSALTSSGSTRLNECEVGLFIGHCLTCLRFLCGLLLCALFVKFRRFCFSCHFSGFELGAIAHDAFNVIA